MNRKIKIACHGLVKKNSGSGIGAQYLILEELLKRGYKVDFFNRKKFIYPEELCKYSNFNYFDVKYPALENLLNSLPNPFKEIILPFANQLPLIRRPNAELLKQDILLNHQTQKYDLLLYLDRRSPVNIEQIPTISWLTGPPQTEWYFIQKLKQNIIALCGLFFYYKLKVFYATKSIGIKSELGYSDILISGSKWSKDKISAYIGRDDNIKVLPYPIDINFFKPKNIQTNRKKNDDKVFLWLGRCDPRKRLDLLLQAYSLLLKERQDIKLKIFGRIGYAKEYKKLIDKFDYPDHLTYQSFINRSDIPGLMANCDVLIQPSEGENFGSSIAEAMSCGLPVILGLTNGTKDYISSSSFVFEEYTPESLKETMLKAIEAVELRRKELALDARKTAEQNFDLSKIVDRLEIIFQEALSAKQVKFNKPIKEIVEQA
ncbi:MAG: glycosyltransferase family 4 protein [Xenococcus sp. MO_188.B8]|nr:glycosyltransferase family 4 protein [Xenococcus sp. MO_188.B8]